jgi:nicotinamidase-related amidase
MLAEPVSGVFTMARPLASLNPSSTALLIVECQNGIVGPGSVLPELAAAAAPMLPTLGVLAGGVRRAGGLVVHLTYVPALGNRSSNRTPRLFGRVLPAMVDWTPTHPATQVVDEVGREPDDLLLMRHSGMSPTGNTEVFAVLRNAGYTDVIIAGVSLNIAIPVVATHAADEGFPSVIPRDAVAGTPVEHAESILRHTLAALSTIATTAEVLTALGLEAEVTP